MKTDIVVTGFVFDKGRLLLIHHNKLGIWIPVGGHIEENEIPEDALKREIREEVGLEVEMPDKKELPFVHALRKNCSTPFHINVHSVGDHDHCSLDFICHANNTDVKENPAELKKSRWFSKEEIANSPEIREDIRNICILAFSEYEKTPRFKYSSSEKSE